MRAYIVTTFIGCFGVAENKKIISFKQFPKDPLKIAEKFKTAEFEVIEEEKLLMQDLWKKGYKEFIFSVRKQGVKHAEPNNAVEQYVKENLRKFAVDYKFVKDQLEFNQLLSKVNIELTKVKIKHAVERDRLIIHANNTIEELDKSINIFIERLREWYGLHFPEMDRAVSNHEKFVKLVEKFGLRKNVEDPELNLIKDKSIGLEISDVDAKIIQELAKQISELITLRESTAKYVDKALKEIAPNLREIAGPQLTAKLISKAGGLEKLAKSPSSTVQLLGAEKALFRYLHGHGKSPKFGILFSHPLIQNAPNEHKGKVARVLAAKLSMAAKIDYYSKKYKADNLKKDLEERVKAILSSK